MSRSLLLPKFSGPKLLKRKLTPPTRLHLTKALLPACACALLSLPLAARAGQWSFSLTGTGTTTDTQGNPAETFPFTDSVPLIPFSPPNGVDVSGGTSGAHCSLICYYGGAVSLDATATLTWLPSYPGDTSAPPPTVDVLETSNAEAGQTLIDPTGVNIFAADGLEDAEVDKVTLIGPMGGSGHTGYDYDTSSSGKQLTHLTVSAGQTTVTVPLRSLSTSLSFASYYGGSSPALYCAYVIQQDSRAVTISADVDQTSYKLLTGGVDANGDGNWAKTAHKPPEMKGDIGIPYGTQQTQNKIPIVTSSNSASVKYTGHLLGNWATQYSHYSWKSSLKDYSTDDSLYHQLTSGVPSESEIPTLGNTYNGPIVDNDTGLIIPNDAGASGSTDNITFKFQNGDNRSVAPAPQFATGNDGDGATAAANYTLTIHQPIEVFPSHKPNEINFRVATPNPTADSNDIAMDFQGLDYSTYKGTDSNGTDSNGVSAICVLNSPAVGWSIASDVTSALSSVPYPGAYGVLDVIFGGANIFINHATPQTINFAADFNDTAWDDPQSDGDPKYKSKTGAKSDYHMSPRVRVNYRWTYKLVDVYNAAGFQSETLNHDEEYVGPQNVFGYFTYSGPAAP